MGKFVNLAGQRYGRLIIISCVGRDKHGNSIWLCKCDCGNEKVIAAYQMKSGTTKSCGCLAHEFTVKKNTTHGMAKTPIYNVWCAMKKRCLNPNDAFYYNYGGRGIKLSEKWSTFEGFYEDMGDTYKKGLTIERRDSNGNYCKENCAWDTRLVQGNNTRRNHRETVNGVNGTLAELCRKHNIPYTTIKRRLERGWTPERSFLTPKLK